MLCFARGEQHSTHDFLSPRTKALKQVDASFMQWYGLMPRVYPPQKSRCNLFTATAREQAAAAYNDQEQRSARLGMVKAPVCTHMIVLVTTRVPVFTILLIGVLRGRCCPT